MQNFEAAQLEWLADGLASWTTQMEVLKPSEWAERSRYLPPQHTALPGPYRFAVTPYLREIIDCLSPESPVREVSLMKGAQVGYTAGIIENGIGYGIDHLKSAPMMLVTADDGLANLRVSGYIIPMLQLSGLSHLIKSSDEGNNRKTGQTKEKIEWVGGGSLIPFGARNAAKLRTFSVQYLFNDEIDGWPLTVSNDGDPYELAKSRTKAYAVSRKIFNGSTPLIEGASKIHALYKQGDQRKYHVRCLKCGFPQELRFRHENNETGVVSGMHWETENGFLVEESVRYLCQNCQNPHFNGDKTRLFDLDINGAKWVPTAQPRSREIRSYHLSGLYSPPGMYSWAEAVKDWLLAWDTQRGQMKDPGKLQVFYNNVLGEPFKHHGEKVTNTAVSKHRRPEYRFGEVPNKWADDACGSPILAVTCAVDVHANNLAVAVFGWCRGARCVLLDYWRFEGNTEDLEDSGTWGRLGELLDRDVNYVADDGTQYQIDITLIDSGYRADTVYRFCRTYMSGVYPVKGLAGISQNATAVKHFRKLNSPLGIAIFGIQVDVYKDRWSSALRHEWSGQGMQREGHFNAPVDITQEQIDELTVETKVPLGNGLYEWRRPSGARNELWDCLVYGLAGLEILAFAFFTERLKSAHVDWQIYWDIRQQHLNR
jgi:phage terminase large subunit GpA-like protein